MTSDLLKCTICPKKPSFSDTSHLLTHVGSKGHLAHLHGLQVRSHQEPNASQQLNVYNQWFQEHGVAALLSERMQQKEQKQADKKAANRRRMAATVTNAKPQGRKPSKKRQSQSDQSAAGIEQARLDTAREARQADNSKSRIHNAGQYPVIPSSPVSIHPQSIDDDEDYVYSIETDTENPGKTSPGSPKLKGIQWPGMALFDAASEELRRKRNQRKDDSVLQMLERNAALVRPRETVCSAKGTVLKHRHMDDLEDDSPVEGEEVIAPPSPKRKKTGATRPPRRANGQASKRVGQIQKEEPYTPSKRSSSSMTTLSRSTSHVSPAADDGKDFKLSIRGLGRKKNKKAAFTIYEDSSPPLGIDGSYDEAPISHVNSSSSRPRYAFSQIPYFRHHTETYDPFKSARERLPASYSTFSDLGTGKENVQYPFLGSTSNAQSQLSANPLFFGSTEGLGTNDLYASTNPLNLSASADDDLFNDEHAFMPVKNPLMSSTEQQDEIDADDLYRLDGSAAEIRQPLFAP